MPSPVCKTGGGGVYPWRYALDYMYWLVNREEMKFIKVVAMVVSNANSISASMNPLLGVHDASKFSPGNPQPALYCE